MWVQLGKQVALASLTKKKWLPAPWFYDPTWRWRRSTLPQGGTGPSGRLPKCPRGVHSFIVSRCSYFWQKNAFFFNRLVCAVKNSFLRRPQFQPALTLSGSVASGWNLMGLSLDSFNRGGRGRHVDVIPSKITTWSGRDVTQEKYKTSSFGTSAVCRLFTFFKIRNSRSKAAHPNFPYKLILMNVNAPLNFNSIKSHSLKIKSLFPLYKLN